jgi:hypothetical protein
MDEQAMTRWVAQATAALGLSEQVDVEQILRLAADAAHGVMRPAAPVTTFLAGLAIGASGQGSQATDDVLATIRAELATWTASGQPSSGLPHL